MQRKVLEPLGGMILDPRYPLYFEDADLCRRLRREHLTMVFYEEQLASIQERFDNEEGPIPDPSLFQVLSWKLNVLVRTLLDLVTRRCPPGEAC